MKRVKFNFTTSIHMIPDEIYEEFKNQMHEMKFKSFKDYQQRLLAGTEFQMADVKIGNTLEVPDWYYEAHKNDLLSIGLSIDNYKDRAGNRMPFIQNGGENAQADAINHYSIEAEKTMDKKPRFELVEEATLTAKKIANSRV